MTSSDARATPAWGVAGSPPDHSEVGRLLVVDDEVFIADALSTSLRYMGYEVRCAFNGRDALRVAQEWKPDLLLLDVMLPDMTGYDVCRRLATMNNDPGVIFLSARDAVSDRVLGFHVGADDYVTKPFSLEEVIARVRALLLRRSRAAAAAQRSEEGLLRYADLVLDDARHEVRRADNELLLSPTEYTLLRFFLTNPERVLSKGQILDHVWPYDARDDAGVVETFVSLLRKKLNTHGDPLIQTVRGFGYMLRST